MPSEIYSLPTSYKSSFRTEWRLDARGLEWTDTDGKDYWLPFACVRRATLGNLEDYGWQLRLSGPPGAVSFATGSRASVEDIDAFSKLSRTMIEGAMDVGCRTRFRLNHSRTGNGWLWQRGGKRLETGKELVSVLPNAG